MQKNKDSKRDKYNEIPIEEFNNDTQDIHEEFLDKFNKKKIEKSIDDSILNKIRKWL